MEKGNLCKYFLLGAKGYMLRKRADPWESAIYEIIDVVSMVIMGYLRHS